MKSKFLFLIALTLFLIPRFAFADIGPKPEVDFTVTLDGAPVSDNIFYAKMLACRDLAVNEDYMPQQLEDCKEQNPNIQAICDKFYSINIPENNKACFWCIATGAWGWECKNSTCNFGYHPPNTFRLAVYLPSQDSMFISNYVNNPYWHGEYELRISSADKNNSVLVDTMPLHKAFFDIGLKSKLFPLSVFLTIIIELFVALVFVLAFKLKKKILLYVLFANLISLVCVWIFIPIILFFFLRNFGIGYIIFTEIFAVFFEAWFIYIVSKKALSFWKVVLLSFLMNMASFFLGNWILSII